VWNKRVELGFVEVFPNAIDLEKFGNISMNEKITLRRELNIPENTIIIGNIARFTEQKNHAFFVELVRALEKQKLDYRVVFVGDGKLREDIFMKIKQMGFSSKVLFLGIRTDIPQLLNIFDVFLMPSFYEGLPVSIIEAQATGIPCLVSDTITEEIDMGLGLISFLSIKSSCEEWINKIIAISNENRDIDRDSIKNALSKNGYEINESIIRLKKIYDLL
jgi:glycosyltransferase EpsF